MGGVGAGVGTRAGVGAGVVANTGTRLLVFRRGEGAKVDPVSSVVVVLTEVLTRIAPKSSAPG